MCTSIRRVGNLRGTAHLAENRSEMFEQGSATEYEYGTRTPYSYERAGMGDFARHGW